MGCSTCSNGNGVPQGCENNGYCQTGGCNKMNTFDWLSHMEISDPEEFDIVEVSFKKGARKEFYQNSENGRIVTGDTVVVDTGTGYDVGQVSLSGELVRLQMRKKKVPADRHFHRVIRKANPRDMERLDEARQLERETMIKARVIARTLDLEMKIGDVEYQGDKRKATFYYTADGRVDFRELVRHYAKEFRIKIEMRQIGSRQESARIGGIGSCGRELCCSTWLSDFRSVTTTAARYQNIAINQTKLSGQCGRLKCCLNYELDTYMEALETFPTKAEMLKTKRGNATLVKMDIFKNTMYYVYDDQKIRGPVIALDKSRVQEIVELNNRGKFPDDLPDRKPEAEKEDSFESNFEDWEIGNTPSKSRHHKKPGKHGRTKGHKKSRENQSGRGRNKSNKK